MKIQILGVNEFGHESGNSEFTDGRDLPFLQDQDVNENGRSDIWYDEWDIGFRDVIILDGDSDVVGVYNLTEHNLGDPDNYDELKNLLVDHAIRDQRPWCNAANKLDVNNDGTVNLTDAQDIVAEINSQGSRKLPSSLPTGGQLRFYDSNFDGYIAPIDVLRVINYVRLSQGAQQSALFAVGLSSEEVEFGSGTQDTKPSNLMTGSLEVSVFSPVVDSSQAIATELNLGATEIFDRDRTDSNLASDDGSLILEDVAQV